MTTLSEQSARYAPRTARAALREGKILAVNGSRVDVELDSEPNDRKAGLLVPYSATPAPAVGQRVAVDETDQGQMIVVARWAA